MQKSPMLPNRAIRELKRKGLKLSVMTCAARWKPEPGRCLQHTCQTYTCGEGEYCRLVTPDPPPYIHSDHPFDNRIFPRCFKCEFAFLLFVSNFGAGPWRACLFWYVPSTEFFMFFSVSRCDCPKCRSYQQQRSCSHYLQSSQFQIIRWILAWVMHHPPSPLLLCKELFCLRQLFWNRSNKFMKTHSKCILNPDLPTE